MKKIDRLFIIDDDDAFQFLTQEIINETHRVREIKTFVNGKQALDYIRNFRQSPEVLPQVILLDLNMPVMDGWTFLKEYHPLCDQLQSEIKINIVTSSIDPADALRASNCKLVSDFIVKPVTEEKLIEIINEIG